MFVVFISMNSTLSTNLSFRAKPIPKDVINKTTRNLLAKRVKDVDIYCHSSADEDTVNSAKVFGNWLIENGKSVNFCVPRNEVKDLYFDTRKYNLKKSEIPADRAVVVDFNAQERLSDSFKNLFAQNKPENIIGYDHHTKGEAPLNGNFYVDDSAKSCCGVLTRFFEGLDRKLNKSDTKSLYCGMVSDYKKSGLLKITKENNAYNVQKTEKLLNDKNSLEVFNKLDKQLSLEEKNNIYKHLDPLSRLTQNEKLLRKRLFRDIKVTPNGKMAYIVIPPKDKLWQKVGMDTPATSEILKDLRVRVSENPSNVDFLSSGQKKDMKNVDTVIAFYRKSGSFDEYRMSIHSKSNSALKLIDNAKISNSQITAGGHPDRAGGKIDSIAENDVRNFVNALVKASDIL